MNSSYVVNASQCTHIARGSGVLYPAYKIITGERQP
jgi:hypothetical protein